MLIYTQIQILSGTLSDVETDFNNLSVVDENWVAGNLTTVYNGTDVVYSLVASLPTALKP